MNGRRRSIESVIFVFFSAPNLQGNDEKWKIEKPTLYFAGCGLRRMKGFSEKQDICIFIFVFLFTPPFHSPQPACSIMLFRFFEGHPLVTLWSPAPFLFVIYSVPFPYFSFILSSSPTFPP